MLHLGIAVVVIDRFAALIHLGNLDVMDKASACRAIVARVDRRRKDGRAVNAVIAHLIRRDLIHRGIRYVLKWLTALEGILLVIGH